MIKGYVLKCWIPVEEDEPEIFATREEALEELAEVEFLQPENIYAIEEVDDEDQ